jgi:hypothetical protein
MTRYMRWMDTLPPQTFSRGYWPRVRWGDNIDSIYWLYNRTGDAFLLPLAKRIHENMQDWSTGIHNQHNVNIAQAFREPTVYWQQAREQKFLDRAERNYHEVMDTYGQFPGGGFAADENFRPGFTDPHQAIETCGIVEFMHSFEMLTKITGDAAWPQRCEEIAFNSLPAALTPDFKALHYLTAANQVQLDRRTHAPGVQNGGVMFSYSPREVYRCCQHNVSHGWPYFAEELFLATPDGGLCASLYSACEVTALVGAGAGGAVDAGTGQRIRIVEETDYPFDDTVALTVSTAQPVAFPLRLRIPDWAQGAEVRINGQAATVSRGPWAQLARTWNNGDRISLKLPMRVAVKTWEKNKNAVSVHYGPLAFSLKIGERWSRNGGTDAFPEQEVFPTTPWNYGLVLTGDPARDFEIVRKPAPPGTPFTPESAPIELRVKAQRIPAWTLDTHGLAAALQPSPIKSGEPVETVTLVPMGAARLRISMFPVIGSAADAHEWTTP